MYTLGDIRKTLNKTELEKYNILFEKYFLKSLTSRLTDYSSNKFEVLSAEQKNSSYTMVQSKILEGDNKPEIKIDWRIYTKDPLKPLIRDLVVEGLSLARTQKEEFSSILSSSNNDINILFKKLEEFISI
jgi:phospholipid transport system substrate-binding protein